MNVNVPKSNLVKFSPSGRSKAGERLLFEGIQLNKERQFEYLGVVLNHNLSFKKHLEDLQTKA